MEGIVQFDQSIVHQSIVHTRRGREGYGLVGGIRVAVDQSIVDQSVVDYVCVCVCVCVCLKER